LIRLSRVGALAASAGVLLAASAASAEDASAPGSIAVFGWYLSNARVGAGVEPDYMGSNDYRFAPSGSVSFARKGAAPGAWGAPDDGFSVGLVGDKALSAGLVGRWRSGRGDDDDLQGFEKIDGVVEAGGFVNWWAADWLRFRGEARHALGGYDGWAVDLGADAVIRTGPWVLSAGPRLSWADDAFTRTYFGVTPTEAALSPFGIPAFAAGGEFWSPGVVASAEYHVSRFWSLTAVGQYRRLTGDAADSPLVADLGSKDQFSASLSVTYTFAP
jgi:MipA family protein